MPQTRRTRIQYGVHPSVGHAARIVENLPARTGRSLEEWATLLNDSGPSGQEERSAWLRKRHGLGRTTIHLIANYAAAPDTEDLSAGSYLERAPKLVEAMYSGPKEHLVPIYEAPLELAHSLGPDVRACPCKTIVPLYRSHVFAEIKPTTRMRVDLGLALKGTRHSIGAPLLETGGLAREDWVTHRIPLSSLEQITSEVGEWLSRAYALDSPPAE